MFETLQTIFLVRTETVPKMPVVALAVDFSLLEEVSADEVAAWKKKKQLQPLELTGLERAVEIFGERY